MMIIDAIIVYSDGSQEIRQDNVPENWYESEKEPPTSEERLTALEAAAADADALAVDQQYRIILLELGVM